jgi:hypothetical protein
MHYETEVRWHDALDAELAAAPEPRAALLPNGASEARPSDEPAAPASSAPKADETTET